MANKRRLFMLSVGELGGAAVFWAVSVACVRASGAAEAGPQYKCILWGQTPCHRVISELDKVASCAAPGGAAAAGEGTPPLVVPASSEEIDLRVRIDVLGPAPAALLAAAP